MNYDKTLNCKPLVSVVMPNYNGTRFVGQAIESVISQAYTNLELIVVDDCSTDQSTDLIQAYCDCDARVKLVKMRKNQGVAITRNIGIQMATGEYIALLDNDDLWEQDKLERQIALALHGADIVYCSYDFIDENNNNIKKPFVVPESTDYNKMLISSVISCSTAFIKSRLLKAHPFKPEFYHEDYVLWMELLSTQVSASGDSKVLMHYRQVTGSRSNRKGNAAKERWNTYRKALKLNIIKSGWVFVRYAFKGVLKYNF